MTARAHRPGWMMQVPAAGTALQQQPPLRESLPEKCAVAGDRRARTRRFQLEASGRRWPRRGAELQDAQAHSPNQRAVLIGELVVIVEEVSRAECGALLIRDTGKAHRLGEAITEL